jgi:hypothetical protein
MPDPREPRAPGPAGPGLGPGGRLPRRVLLRRGAVALALACSLALAKQGVSWQAARVTTERQPYQAVATGLLIGPPPPDYNLRGLSSSLGVAAVVEVGPPSIVEQVTARSLHLAYLYLAVKTNGSPTRSQLNELDQFVRENTSGHKEVYMNDNGTWALVTTTAAMLLLLRGQSWTSVSTRLGAGELGTLCVCQRHAIARLSSALARSASHQDASGHALAVRS